MPGMIIGMDGEAPPNRLEVKMPPKMGRQLLVLFARVSLMLAILLVGGCYLVAQPSMRKNEPSDKTADQDRLRKHVVALSETFHPRDFMHPQNLNRSADYIAAEMKAAGALVEMQDYTVQGETFRNVIGRFGAEKSKTIIIGAHYDSCGDTPGADDNASGVAGLLELARLVGKDEPDCAVELVAYTLEEPPFFRSPQMGSAIHAASVAPRKDRIIGVIVLEMIGYFSDEPGSQAYPLPLMTAHYPDKGDFITVVSKWNQGDLISDVKAGMKGTTDLPVYSFRGPASLQGIDFSDHRNYWPHDIPAVMITNTAFYRNVQYHTPQDTADRLDYVRMGKVVVGVYEAIRSLSR
jgi:Zn-dependent M28 family amino/carboxypeptidase